MMLSRDSRAAVIDLIENRISVMHIGDQDDFREMIALKRALSELHAERQGTGAAEAGILKDFADIPRRGRRRKVSSMLGETDRV
jgi:hypothetical protein